MTTVEHPNATVPDSVEVPRLGALQYELGFPTPETSQKLFDEIECNCTDQHACAEAHDQPDHADGDVDSERDDGADHERRRRQQPPTERSAHLAPRVRNGPNGERAPAHRLSVHERRIHGLIPSG